MKRVYYAIWMLVASPTILFAQPPEEEVAPVAPEFNIEVSEVPVEGPSVVPMVVPMEAPSGPAPVLQQQAAPSITNIQPQVVPNEPIVPPTEIKAPEPKEDRSVRGITLSPSVTLTPLGYTGERGDDQTYFGFSPALGLSSLFKTAQNREISFNLGYTFIWNEMYSNRALGVRYFEHELAGDSEVEWLPYFTTKIKGNFNYSLWASEESEHTVFSEDNFSLNFKITDQITVSPNYQLRFFNLRYDQIFLSDLPSDGDDVRAGNIAISGADPIFFDPFNPGFENDVAVSNVWFANNGLALDVGYKPTKSTGLAARYEYVFATFTNNPDSNWHGHWFEASIKQKLPWKGGVASLKDQVRIRDFQSQLNSSGNTLHNVRNRLTLVLGQEITEFLSAEMFYRWEINPSNKDNYEELNTLNYFYVGFTFGI